MRLNIGCGFNKLPGFVNVDGDALCEPDVVANLEERWPFEDNSVEYIVANHVLEHLGETTAKWMGLWKEIWRVCKNDARMEIRVPHPRHENFITDPTHVRVILPGTIAMFDQSRNIRDLENHGQETKLGLMNGIDLEVTKAGYDLMEPWKSAVQSGKMSDDDVQRDLLILNNVCSQIIMEVKIVKPCRGEALMKSRSTPPAPGW